MGRTLTATQIAAKNSLADAGSWIILCEISVTRIKKLNFDGQTSNFILGDIVRGGTSRAFGRVIGMSDLGSYGALTLWDVRGAFVDDETLTGDGGGTAYVNGTLSNDDRTLRYACSKEDIVWNGQTWTRTAMQIDTVSKTLTGKHAEAALLVFNDETLCAYVENCLGLEGERITLRLVYSGNLAESAACADTFTIVGTTLPSREWVQFLLGMDRPLATAFPAMRYDYGNCRHKFKDPSSCQYAGATTTCDRKLSTCAGLSNEAHYGSFPGIPGGIFE